MDADKLAWDLDHSWEVLAEPIQTVMRRWAGGRGVHWRAGPVRILVEAGALVGNCSLCALHVCLPSCLPACVSVEGAPAAQGAAVLHAHLALLCTMCALRCATLCCAALCRYNIPEPYEKLKAFTRGQAVTQQSMQEFVGGIDGLPEGEGGRAGGWGRVAGMGSALSLRRWRWAPCTLLCARVSVWDVVGAGKSRGSLCTCTCEGMGSCRWGGRREDFGLGTGPTHAAGGVAPGPLGRCPTLACWAARSAAHHLPLLAHYSPLPANAVLGAAFQGPRAEGRLPRVGPPAAVAAQRRGAHTCQLIPALLCVQSIDACGLLQCIPSWRNNTCIRPFLPRGADVKQGMLAWTPATYTGNAAQQAKNLKQHLAALQ